MRYFVVAMVVWASVASAGQSHFYLPATAFRPCAGSNAVPTAVGADNKPAFTLIDSDSACLEAEVWFPEHITGTQVSVIPVFSTAATGTNVCLIAAYTVSPLGGNWAANTGMLGSEQGVVISLDQSASLSYYTAITNIQAYDQSRSQDCASVADCQNSQGILVIARRQSTCVVNDTPGDITFTGADFYYPAP